MEVIVHYMDRNRASAGGKTDTDETARHQMNFGLFYLDNTPKPSFTIVSNYLLSNGSPNKVGDINKDGLVNISDLSALLAKWGTSDTAADINKDRTVNVSDLSMLLSKWGT